MKEVLSSYIGRGTCKNFEGVPGPRERLGFFPSPPDIFSKVHFPNVTSSRVRVGVSAEYQFGGGENKYIKHVKRQFISLQEISTFTSIYSGVVPPVVCIALYILKSSALSNHCLLCMITSKSFINIRNKYGPRLKPYRTSDVERNLCNPCTSYIGICPSDKNQEN